MYDNSLNLYKYFTNSFYQWFEDQLTQLNTTVHENLEKRKTHTDNRLDELNTRITNLEAHFEDEKRTILKYVDDRGAELTALLNKFKVFYFR